MELQKGAPNPPPPPYPLVFFYHVTRLTFSNVNFHPFGFTENVYNRPAPDHHPLSKIPGAARALAKRRPHAPSQAHSHWQWEWAWQCHIDVIVGRTPVGLRMI